MKKVSFSICNKMEAIIGGFKDLFRLYVTNNINIEDKLMANSAINMAVVLFGIIFSKPFFLFLYDLYTKYITKAVITPANFSYFETKINDPSFKLEFFRIHTDRDVMRLVGYFSSFFGWKLRDQTTLVFNPKTLEVESEEVVFGSTYHNTILKNIPENEIFPIYIGKGLIGLFRCKSECLYIACEYVDDFKVFWKEIEKYAFKDKKKEEIKEQISEKKTITARKYFESLTYTIFPDRNFDLFVSRFKDEIINALDTFQNTQKAGVSCYNGMGTYNLGFMLYGKPGTGKTSLIKAICNYLGRNAIIIDMRKVTNVDTLNDIFEREHNVKENVFILEEFDCVQGVIDRKLKDGSSLELKRDKDLAILQDRKLELLKIEKPSTSIENELKKIDKEIYSIENCITIDAFLVLLDGVIEVRGRCIIATTNHIENIDPALMREGRFDHKINLGPFNDQEIKDLLTLMFKGNATEKEFKYLYSTKFKDEVLTPAKIINICQRCRSLRKSIDYIKKETK